MREFSFENEWPTQLRNRAKTLGILTLLVLFAQFAIAGSASAAEQPPYRIGPEDILHISVWREPELDRQVVVRPDGGVSFPLAGDVVAAGKTAEELQQAITAKISTYIPEAVVTVSVEEIRGMQLYVTGQVNNPGQYQGKNDFDYIPARSFIVTRSNFPNIASLEIINDCPGSSVIFVAFDPDRRHRPSPATARRFVAFDPGI